MSTDLVRHGEIMDARDEQIADLKDEIAALRQEVSDARSSANRTKRLRPVAF